MYKAPIGFIFDFYSRSVPQKISFHVSADYTCNIYGKATKLACAMGLNEIKQWKTINKFQTILQKFSENNRLYIYI